MRLTDPRLPDDPKRLLPSLYDTFRRIVAAVNTLEDSRVLRGAGSPLNVVVANIGTLYVRTDGGAGSTLYVKEANSGASTGWVAK